MTRTRNIRRHCCDGTLSISVVLWCLGLDKKYIKAPILLLSTLNLSVSQSDFDYKEYVLNNRRTRRQRPPRTQINSHKCVFHSLYHLTYQTNRPHSFPPDSWLTCFCLVAIGRLILPTDNRTLHARDSGVSSFLDGFPDLPTRSGGLNK